MVTGLWARVRGKLTCLRVFFHASSTASSVSKRIRCLAGQFWKCSVRAHGNWYSALSLSQETDGSRPVKRSKRTPTGQCLSTAVPRQRYRMDLAPQPDVEAWSEPFQRHPLELEPRILRSALIRIGEVRFEEPVYLVDDERDIRYAGYRHLFLFFSDISSVRIPLLPTSVKGGGTHEVRTNGLVSGILRNVEIYFAWDGAVPDVSSEGIGIHGVVRVSGCCERMKLTRTVCGVCRRYLVVLQLELQTLDWIGILAGFLCNAENSVSKICPPN